MFHNYIKKTLKWGHVTSTSVFSWEEYECWPELASGAAGGAAAWTPWWERGQHCLTTSTQATLSSSAASPSPAAHLLESDPFCPRPAKGACGVHPSEDKPSFPCSLSPNDYPSRPCCFVSPLPPHTCFSHLEGREGDSVSLKALNHKLNKMMAFK